MHCAFNDVRMIIIPNIIKALVSINLRKKKINLVSIFREITVCPHKHPHAYSRVLHSILFDKSYWHSKCQSNDRFKACVHLIIFDSL